MVFQDFFNKFNTFTKCSNCSIEWKRKYVKNEIDGNIFFTIEHMNVHVREDLIPETRKAHKTYRCLRCFKEYIKTEDILTKEDFIKAYKENEEELKNIKIVEIDDIKEDQLNDDELGKMIGL